MPDELWPGVGFDHVFMNLLGQLVLCKLGEGAAESRFAGNLPGLSQPQSCRNNGRDFRASMSALVVGN